MRGTHPGGEGEGRQEDALQAEATACSGDGRWVETGERKGKGMGGGARGGGTRGGALESGRCFSGAGLGSLGRAGE